MVRRAEVAMPAAAAVVVLTAVLGGGFPPVQRLLIGTLLILVWVVVAVQWRGRLQTPELAVAGLIVWGAISAVWVGAAPLASKESIVAWVVALALWIVSRRGSGLARTVCAQVLAWGAAAVAAGVLVSAVAAASVRVGGPFENPNVAAAFLVPVIPLGIVVLRQQSWLRWGWLVLMSAAVVLTGSRAGLLAAVVIAAILLPRGRIRFLGVFAGGSLAVSALVWRFVSQPDLLAWHRVSIWWAALKIWATRPLTGVGPGCLVEAAGVERILHPDQLGRYQFVINFSESTPLAVMVQLGLVGVVLAALAAGLWLLCAKRSGALESAAFRAGMASVLTLSLFHDFLTVEPVLWWWAVVFGCFEAMSRRDSESTAALPAEGLRLAGAAAMVWLTAWGILSPALARWVSSVGPITKTVVERALRVEPWYPEPAARRVRDLLARTDPWSWETAAEALHWASFVVKIHPGMARRWADLGRVHIRVLTDLLGTGHDEKAAREALTRACELDPHLPWHWLERARVERILGSQDDALRFTRRALAEEPNTVRAWLMLSRLELERGRVDAAREALAGATTRATLIDRPGLTDYERELLALHHQQLKSLLRELWFRDE
jgi:hypothetical protein